jgi:hypothetical protein
MATHRESDESDVRRHYVTPLGNPGVGFGPNEIWMEFFRDDFLFL